MAVLTVITLLLIIKANSGLLFECPNGPVAYGSVQKMTCSSPNEKSWTIIHPLHNQIVSCNSNTNCIVFRDEINASITGDTLLLTLPDVNKEDEGTWFCQSGPSQNCSLNVYKIPTCEINSDAPTNNLSIGQHLSLSIDLNDYYCTSSIGWNFLIGGKLQNISEFLEPEETKNISSRIVRHSLIVTSSLTGSVKLNFNCNSQTYGVECSGEKELKLRGNAQGNIIGIAVGVPIGILLFIGGGLAVFFLWRRRKNKPNPTSDRRWMIL